MARQFGSYSPAWPLGTSIIETFLFEDEAGNPVDLTDADVRMQIREERPERDPTSGQAPTVPLLELTTDLGLYPPAFDDWPVDATIQVGLDPDDPDPTDGYIVLQVDATRTWLLSETNERAKLVYDIEILMPDGDVIPLLRGKITMQPRDTLELPT